MRSLLLIAALTSLAMPAVAADMAVKAPPLAPVPACMPSNCSGWYAGMNLTGTMTNADIIGNGVGGSLAGGGQSIGAQGGYQFANGTWFFGPEFAANYVVTGNDPTTGSAKYRIGEYVKVGTTLANILNLGSGSATGPGIPAALANSVISPYLLFGAVQSGFGQGWATGAGVEFSLVQNWFLDTRYQYNNYGGGATVMPGVVAKSENLVTAGLNYKF